MNEALSPPLLASNLLDNHFQGGSLISSENVKGLDYIRHCKADIMPDVMTFLAKDPFLPVPSVFENFKEASTTSWWKLGLRMGSSEGIVQFALSLTGCVQFGRTRKTVFDWDGVHLWLAPYTAWSGACRQNALLVPPAQ